jgi:peptidoglycan hydrolase-like protein with peptidoglycan-binding domain
MSHPRLKKSGATQKAFESTDAEAEPLSAAAASAKAWSETAVKALVEDEDASATGREDLWGDEKSRNKTAFEEIRLRETQNPDLAKKNAKKWPVLRPEDGGWETHKLQVLLDEQGYYSGEEDMEYWYFGTTTENALGTFQASNGIPDTGPDLRQHVESSFGRGAVFDGREGGAGDGGRRRLPAGPVAAGPRVPAGGEQVRGQEGGVAKKGRVIPVGAFLKSVLVVCNSHDGVPSSGRRRYSS